MEEVIVSALKRMKVETGSLLCMGCGLEHNCSTKGCRILRGAVEHIELLRKELEQEKNRVAWATGRLLRAVDQLKNQTDSCESCAHSGTQVPCVEDEDPTMLCDTCQRECACKTCTNQSGWIWNGGGYG